MHSKSLPGLEGKARIESLTRKLGDPIGLLYLGDRERRQGRAMNKEKRTEIGNK
jgi:hypothetical protein